MRSRRFLPELLIDEKRWDLDAIYIPEVDFDIHHEVVRLKKIMDEKDGVNIFLSEGAGQEMIIREMENKGQNIPRDAFGHVRLDEINPGQWFAEQLSNELNAEKTLVQKSGYFSRSAKANQRDLELIKSSAYFGAQNAIDHISGVAGIDDMDGELKLIQFSRIKGGKPFNIQEDWYQKMLEEIGQK